MPAKWSVKAQEERLAKQKAETIARRLRAIELLRKNGWTVVTKSLLSLEIVKDDTPSNVFWVAKMPGAAPVMITQLEALERKCLGYCGSIVAP